MRAESVFISKRKLPMFIKFIELFVSGKCICRHNTVGDNCERCAPGYYGYALAGTPDDCKLCPCPDNGECVELLNGQVACINCKPGYTGLNLHVCSS